MSGLRIQTPGSLSFLHRRRPEPPAFRLASGQDALPPLFLVHMLLHLDLPAASWVFTVPTGDMWLRNPTPRPGQPGLGCKCPEVGRPRDAAGRATPRADSAPRLKSAPSQRGPLTHPHGPSWCTGRGSLREGVELPLPSPRAGPASRVHLYVSSKPKPQVHGASPPLAMRAGGPRWRLTHGQDRRADGR